MLSGQYLFSQSLPYTAGIPQGKIHADELQEVSGLLASRINKGSFFVHNDSGDQARVYLINDTAGHIATYSLENITAIDCEDIASVEIDGYPYLVLADIGDNLGKRKNIQLYIFKEPQWNQVGENRTIPSADIRVVTLEYPDKARDAEAIFIDPVDNQFYLISKRDFKSTVYTAHVFGHNRPDNFMLEARIQLPFTFVTAADISPDGSEILIKNLLHIYHWKRNSKESILHTLQREAITLSYIPEPQGEAIAFDLAGQGFYTLSERALGLNAYFYYYKKTNHE